MYPQHKRGTRARDIDFVIANKNVSILMYTTFVQKFFFAEDIANEEKPTSNLVYSSFWAAFLVWKHHKSHLFLVSSN